MLPTRRQKAVLEAIQDHIAETGQPPTLQEIAGRCGLSSVATVHRHLALLQERGLLRRRRSRRRGIELKAAARTSMAVQVPLLGVLEAGRPIAALPGEPTAAVPREMVPRPALTFVLRVRGESMRGEQILDGDLILAERRERPADGDVVVVLDEARGAAIRTVHRDGGRLRLQPLDPALAPSLVGPHDVTLVGVVTGLLRRYD
jgi:repressor LexA